MTRAAPKPQDTDITQTTTGPPALTIDWDRYGDMLDASDLSDDQKRAFIETLWSIMVSFVDLGFGLNPVQKACGEPLDLSSLGADDVLSLEATPKPTFNAASEPPAGCSEERTPR